jgi:hypothetical protein
MASRARAAQLIQRPMFLPVAWAVVLAFLLLAALSFTEKTDYSVESQPAFEALRDGHIGLFLDRCPAYGGSLILRAPLALLPNLWNGGPIALYRCVSSPAILLLLVYAVVLSSTALRLGARRRGAWLAMFLLMANPLAAYALLTGHSEEVIVTIACLGAAFATRTDRAGLAGLLFGIAVACKPWALVAGGPLLLALDAGRIRFLAVATVAVGVILLPLLIHGGEGLAATGRAARTTGSIANPWQIWWFFGENLGPVHRSFGHVYNDYRTEPDWITRISHPLVVIVPAAICLARPRVLNGRPWHDLFLLLAAVLFLRCLIDTWNHHYYALPTVLALGTWEVLALRRAPYVAWAATLLTLATIVVTPTFASADLQSVLYLLWALPFAAWLLASALRGDVWIFERVTQTLE